MAEETIQCWSCGTRMTLDELSANDGDCPECAVEIALAEYLTKALADNAALRAQLPSQVGEAVAWMLADAVGGSMLEFQRDLLLENQCRYGGEIVPLYTHPADQAAEGVVVSRELLDLAYQAVHALAGMGIDGYTEGRCAELRQLLAKSEGVKK